MPESQDLLPERSPLPKGVIRIDGLSSVEIRKAIKENKILLGTKEELQQACEQVGLNLPVKPPRDAQPNDAWFFNGARNDNPNRAEYYQVSILFIDSDNNAGIVDFASDGGFGVIMGTAEKVGFIINQDPAKIKAGDYMVGHGAARSHDAYTALSAISNMMTEKI